MAELSETGKVIVGAFRGIADALSPTPGTAEVRPEVQPTLGIPKEFLMLGGLMAIGVIGVLLITR